MIGLILLLIVLVMWGRHEMHEQIRAIEALSIKGPTGAPTYEDPFTKAERQPLLNVSYGAAMSRAQQVSKENGSQFYVVQEEDAGFSAVPQYQWLNSGRKLIAIFDGGWQLPQGDNKRK